MCNFRAVFGPSFCITINFLVIIADFNYDMKNLIMMQKPPLAFGLLEQDEQTMCGSVLMLELGKWYDVIT